MAKHFYFGICVCRTSDSKLSLVPARRGTGWRNLAQMMVSTWRGNTSKHIAGYALIHL